MDEDFKKAVNAFILSQNKYNIKIFEEIASLKGKITVWSFIGGGLAGGISVVLVSLLVEFLKK